jgi:AraC-like DNA-binding protein
MPATAIAAVNPAAPAIRCVSTDDVKLSQRREFWETTTTTLCGSHEVEVLGSDPLSAAFEYAEVSNLLFSRLTSRTGHRVLRTIPLARRDERNFVKIVLMNRGSCLLEQKGRTTHVRAGEWAVYDNAQAYRMTVPGRAQMFLLLIPRDRFVDRSFNLENFVARRLSGRAGLGKLIWNLISNTFDQIPQILNTKTDDVAEIIIQMARLALSDFSIDRGSVDSKAALRDRMKLYIAGHLGDPDLSIERLAHATGCTKRYLHMAFRPEQISISDYILRQRLERCREELVTPVSARKSITEIAYSWGFNNSNHFSRCFKQAFGASPRDLRQTGRPASELARVKPRSQRIGLTPVRRPA